MNKRTVTILRELFFLVLALAILYNQVFMEPTAQPILIFTAIFFLGSIPALRGDKSEQPNPFVRLFLAMLGVATSALKEENEEEESDDSQLPTP